MLHPSPQPIREDPDALNNYFITNTERTLGTEPEHTGPVRFFALRQVTLKEVIQETGKLRTDCSSGVDKIPLTFIKLDLDGPLTYIIHTCNESSSFPQVWKVAPISPIPKIPHPKDKTDHGPIYIHTSAILRKLKNLTILYFYNSLHVTNNSLPTRNKLKKLMGNIVNLRMWFLFKSRISTSRSGR